MRVGPFYVSSSSRRRTRRGPSAAQRRAQAAAAAEHRAYVARKRAQRRATYGPFKLADARTWFSWHWLGAIIALGVVAALPSMLGDGPIAETIWLVAVVIGVSAWGIWVVQLHSAQAPTRRAAAQQATFARQQAEAEAARRAGAYAAFIAPRQIGRAWHHGNCTINHRTYDAAARCRRG